MLDDPDALYVGLAIALGIWLIWISTQDRAMSQDADRLADDDDTA